MRIIGGNIGGIKLNPPNNLPVRPTTDRTKEAIFNWLNARVNVAGLNAIDLFSGTGNLSFELASRQVNSVLSIDVHYACLQYIKKQAILLNLNQISTIKADVFKWLLQTEFNSQIDLIIADPPYAHPSLRQLPKLVLDLPFFKKGGYFILEHGSNMQFEKSNALLETRKYGQSCVSYFQK